MNPMDVTKFDRTRHELEVFFFYCVVVAGRNSNFAAQTVSRIVSKVPEGMTLFEHFEDLGDHGLRNFLVAHRVGQYGRIGTCLEWTMRNKVDLAAATVEDLERIPGVGPKTARFFVLHSRPDAECVPLDVHVLKWLGMHEAELPQYLAPLPGQTPQKQETYLAIERAAVELMRRYFPGLPLAKADLLVWASISGRI